MTSTPTPLIDVANHSVFSYKPAENPDNPYKYVYHYTSWERLLDIAETGLRLGPLVNMNDPRESKDWYLSTIREAGTSIDMVAFNKAVADFRRKIRVGAFCLDQFGSADNGGLRGYAHPRMWAQYAQNHRGVCIVMDRGGIGDAIHRRYPDRNGSWVYEQKVSYVETATEDPTSRVVELLDDKRSIVVIVRDHLTRLAGQLFFVKHIDWRDENEYRWVYYDADESGTGANGLKTPFVDIKSHVVALVLGADYANANLPVARFFAQRHGLRGDVVKCQWNRLNLGLIPFAEDGDRWSPIQSGPYTIHLLAKRENKASPDTPDSRAND